MGTLESLSNVSIEDRDTAAECIEWAIAYMEKAFKILPGWYTDCTSLDYSVDFSTWEQVVEELRNH